MRRFSEDHTCAEMDTIVWMKKYKLIPATRDEEKELVSRAKQGDEDAKWELVFRNLGIIIRKAWAWNHSSQLGDLVSFGIEAVNLALPGYNLSKGYRFTTYLGYWINERFQKRIPSFNDHIKVPVNNRMYYKRLEQYMFVNGIYDPGQVDCVPNLTDEQLKIAKRTLWFITTSYSHSYDDDNSPLIERVEDPQADSEAEAIDNISSQIIREHLLAELGSDEQYVVREYFGFNGVPKELNEIGQNMGGISKEAVRQIKERAIRKIQQAVLGNRALRQFLHVTRREEQSILTLISKAQAKRSAKNERQRRNNAKSKQLDAV